MSRPRAALRPFAALIACLVVTITSGRPAAADPIDELLAAAPAAADLAAIVPQPLVFSRNARELLAGMERDALLLGADPFDQVTSLLGVPLHLRTGAPMGLFVGPDGGVLVVAVHDPAKFLDGNFRPAPAEGRVPDGIRRVLHASDTVLFARAFERHVWLGLDPRAVGGAPTGRDVAASRRATWGVTAARLLRRADVFVAATQPGVARIRGDLEAAGPTVAAALRLADELVAEGRMMLGLADAGDGLEDAGAGDARFALAFDFDPLGLVLRGAWRPGIEWTPPPAEAAAPSRFEHLPSGPSLFVADVDAVGLRAVVTAPDASADAAPGVTRIGLLLREPGAGEPMFGRAVLDVAPAAAGRAAIARAVPAVGRRLLAGRLEVAMVGDRLVSRPPALPPELPASPMALAVGSLLLGPTGPAGELEAAPADAIRLRSGPRVVVGGMLADDGVVRAMRAMLPADRLAEGYLDLARWNERLGPLRPLLGPALGLGPARPGERGLVAGLFTGQPPIGASLARSEDALEVGMVVPAPVAAALVDVAVSAMANAR